MRNIEGGTTARTQERFLYLAIPVDSDCEIEEEEEEEEALEELNSADVLQYYHKKLYFSILLAFILILISNALSAIIVL